MTKLLTTIYPFTEFQVGFLRVLFRQEEAPEPHNTEIRKVARTDNGDLLIEYKHYQEFHTTLINAQETEESYRDRILSKL